MISDEYKQYLDVFEKANQNIDAIRLAEEDAKAQDLVIISPNFAAYSSEETLDDRWEKYMQMTKPFRRKADWITIERFGMNNQTIYEIMKAKEIEMTGRYPVLSKEEAPAPVGESATEYEPMTEFERIGDVLNSYTIDEIAKANEKAVEFMNETNIFMLCPVLEINSIPELEEAYGMYNAMIHIHKRKSNWKMEELYGITNLDYYTYMYHMLSRFDTEKKSYNGIPAISESNRSLLEFSKRYLNNLVEMDDITPNDIAECISNIIDIPGMYEGIIGGDVISDALDKYDGLTANVPTIDLDVSDLPMYTPDELIDMGIYSGNDVVDNSEWFSEYCDYFYSGICSESFLKHNMERIRILEKWSYGLQDINAFEYGWNPYVPFNGENRSKADRRIESILRENMNTTSFIDLRGFETNNIPEVKLEAEENKSRLNPVFIVMEEGKTPIFSDLVRKASKGIYSHAMISFDSSLENLYSYGMEGSVRMLGGFIMENIKNKPKNAMLKVYAFFVNNDIFETMKKNIEWFKENQKKTIYSWHKLFAYAFNIPTSSDNIDFICSEFVDKMLKVAGIDLTKNYSNLIAPNDIDRAAKKNRKVYTIFSDKIANYNQAKIDKIVARVSKKAKPIREFSLYNSTSTTSSITSFTRIASRDMTVLSELNYCVTHRNTVDSRIKEMYNRLIEPCLEAREIPVKITKQGDIIIRNLTPIDFEAAYSKSHKLLMEYEKAGNIEGMKKELAYLWYLNIILEKRIHAPTIKDEKKKEFEKARAKILNDFKTYMKVVQEKDKNFDFRTYFEDTDYSDAAYKISGTTVKSTFKLIKTLI